MQINRGDLLISYPYLEDNYFFRSVICMLEHNEEGSFGLILNKKMPNKIGEIIPDLGHLNNPIYMGGPVETQNLFFIHPYKDLRNTLPIANGLFWNGDLSELKDMFEIEFAKPEDVRFFLGYSGWGSKQLEDEIREKSWFLGHNHLSIIQHDDEDDMLWRKSIELLGADFEDIAHFPIDPCMN